MSHKLVSIDLKSDFGFFRKPDINAGIHLSYNMIHKPALLGILGAIIGLEGYTEKGKIPAYYTELETLKTGVQPLNHDKGNYVKTVIKYSNAIGYANKGTTFLTEEVTLIKPSYRCFLLIDPAQPAHQKLYEYLSAGQAEYLPYFGKNEFYASWEDFQEYEYEKEDASKKEKAKKIITLILKNNIILQGQQPTVDMSGPVQQEEQYLYFERLPAGFDRVLNQYDLQEFAYSTFAIKSASLQDLYLIKSTGLYVQLL